MPSCASETASLTPRRPRRSARRNSPLARKYQSPCQHLAPTISADAHGDRDRDDDRHDEPSGRRYRSRYGTALDGTVEDLHLRRSSHRRDTGSGDARHTHRLDEVVDGSSKRPGCASMTAVSASRPSGVVQELGKLARAWECAARLRQSAPHGRDSAGQPEPPSAIARAGLVPTSSAISFGSSRSSRAAIGISTLQQRAQVHHVVGHRWCPQVGSSNPTCGKRR